MEPVEEVVDTQAEPGQPTEETEPEEPEIEWDWFSSRQMVDVTPENFSRIAGQTAKQVFRQRVHEAERSIMYDEYADRVGEIVTGIVQQDDAATHSSTWAGWRRILPGSEKVPGERYEQGSRIKAVIIEVRSEGEGPQVVLSGAPTSCSASCSSWRCRRSPTAWSDPQVAREPGLSGEDRRRVEGPGCRPGRRLRRPAWLPRPHGRV